MKFTIRGLESLIDEMNLSTKETWIIVAGLSPFLVFFVYIFIVGAFASQEQLCQRIEDNLNEEFYEGLVMEVDTTSIKGGAWTEITLNSTKKVTYSSLYTAPGRIRPGDALAKNSGEMFVEVCPPQDACWRFSLSRNCDTLNSD